MSIKHVVSLMIAGYFCLSAQWVQAQPGSNAPKPIVTPPPKTLIKEIVYSDENLAVALPPKVIILLDSSGSMGQLMDESKSKMFYSKKLFNAYLQDQWREKALVGMLVYGGKKKNDCKDIFMAVKPGETSLSKIDESVKALEPVGMTPIAASLDMAIQELRNYPGPKRIMIFTDGEETCGGDSCEVFKKAMEEKVVDLEMFVTGIGMEASSRDLDKLKCLGKGNIQGAPDSKSLAAALGNISNKINESQGKNLFVEAPDPRAEVRVFKKDTKEKSALKFLRSFTSSWGVKVDPGEYYIEVLLEPPFIFNSVKIPPKKKVTLKVEGRGMVTVDFFENLLEVEVLNKDKKVIKQFLSDEPQILKAGRYDIKISGGQFWERYERDFQINPGGDHHIKVDSLGVVQFDHPSMVGVHIYSSSDKLIGKHVTNFPMVLKSGSYRFFINEECDLKSISVRGEKTLQKISCPPVK